MKRILIGFSFFLFLFFFIFPKESIIAAPIDTCYECLYTGRGSPPSAIQFFKTPCGTTIDNQNYQTRVVGGQNGLCTSAKPTCDSARGCTAPAVQSCVSPSCCYCDSGNAVGGACSDGSPTYHVCTLQPGWTCNADSRGCTAPALYGKCSLCSATNSYTTTGICDGGTLTAGDACTGTCDPSKGCVQSGGGTGTGNGPPSENAPIGGGVAPQIPNLSALGIVGVPIGGVGTLNKVLGVAVSLLILIAILLCLIYIIWGAYFWITSEGDKQKLHQARQRIIFAIIGLILVFLAYAILAVVNNFFFGTPGSKLCPSGIPGQPPMPC